MIIRTELLQESCSKILNAVDSNVLSAVTETLEITVKDKVFTMAVTNRTYFVEINRELDVDEEFHATVNANLFLRLVSKVTSETIELSVDGNSLFINCNGNYKLPLIYEGSELMKLPRINIENEVEKFDISSAALHSIVNYNSKELVKGVISKPVQRLYYIDNKGAITFTSGACINSFETDVKSRLLLNDKLVKLFKLFTDDKVVVTVGHNTINEDTSVTVASFEAPHIMITALLNCDDDMLISYPVDAIRGRAETVYPFTVSINKDLLLESIDRLMLFSVTGSKADLNQTNIRMHFGSDSVVVMDHTSTNKEEVPYAKHCDELDEYDAIIDSNAIVKTLGCCVNQFVSFSFGNNQAFVLAEGAIRWVIPQCRED